MTKEDATAWAMTCWTTPDGAPRSSPEVTEAIANTLVMRTKEAVDAYRLTQARGVFAEAFAADPHFRYGYVANVAMRMVDRIGNEVITHAEANRVADEIIGMLFEGRP